MKNSSLEIQNCSDLRVLIVGTYPPPFGGIATHLTSLIPGLARRKAADIAIVTLGNDDKIDKIKDAIVYRYRASKHYLLLLNPLNWPIIFCTLLTLSFGNLGIKKLLSECIKAILVNNVAKIHNSNVVAFYHSDAHFEMIPLSKYWGEMRGIVLTVFGEVYGSPEFMRQHVSLIKKMIEIPDKVWASSDHCANSFNNLGINRSINTIYLGVDLDEGYNLEIGKKFREDNQILENEVVVLFVGRFIKDMGLDVLLSIVPGILEKYKNVRFILAGAKGHLSDEAANLATKYSKKILIFQDFAFSIQGALFNSSNIVVAPSFDQRACMGLSIKEAMAANLAVVATNCGGIPEAVIPNETGFLVELDPATKSADIAKLDEYICKLIDNTELRNEFGVMGRKRAEELFSVETTVSKVIDTFIEVTPQ